MPVYHPPKIPSSEITPRKDYLRRRDFLGAATIGALGLYGASDARAAKLSTVESKYVVDEQTTPLSDITTYNNFYEFGLDKGDPARLSGDFKPQPWTDHGRWHGRQARHLRSRRPHENIPDRKPDVPHALRRGLVDGHPVGRLPAGQPARQGRAAWQREICRLRDCSPPRRDAGAERRVPVAQLALCRGSSSRRARHPLTLLAVGLYGKALPNQNGAPIRLVVPWKYGFKGIKSIVRITLTDKQPTTTWQTTNPQEYGFYANVNPEVDHPRWSPATERRIGESGFFSASRRKTLPFNGYADEVAGLYAGMDLRVDY